jgi:cytochrome c-type biogenesis protein CcmE
MRIPHAKFICAGGLIVAAICYLMLSGINDAMVYYYTVTELDQQGDDFDPTGIRVSGHVRPGTIQRDDSGSRVDFVVYERASDRDIDVTYEGLIPDTFKDNAEVVVEGIYDPVTRHFRASTLLAKCPSKYEAMGDEHPVDLQKVSSIQ